MPHICSAGSRSEYHSHGGTKTMKNHNLAANTFFIGWKEYNSIKKKAIDSKLSGKNSLVISVSIAFFVVLTCAQLLKMAYAVYQ
jgi:hypothetical protein